jgi:hypothetical protein
MWLTWACTIPYLSKEKPFESSTRTPFFRPEPVNQLFSRPLPLLSNGDLPVSLYPSPQASQEAMSASGSFLSIESNLLAYGLWNRQSVWQSRQLMTIWGPTQRRKTNSVIQQCVKSCHLLLPKALLVAGPPRDGGD